MKRISKTYDSSQNAGIVPAKTPLQDHRSRHANSRQRDRCYYQGVPNDHDNRSSVIRSQRLEGRYRAGHFVRLGIGFNRYCEDGTIHDIATGGREHSQQWAERWEAHNTVMYIRSTRRSNDVEIRRDASAIKMQNIT
jgi:hypothetical protein